MTPLILFTHTGLLEGFNIRESISYIEEHINRQVSEGNALAKMGSVRKELTVPGS